LLRQYELVDRVKAYDANANEDALNRAYVFSMVAHGSQVRASGDPYFSHPVEVAGILSDLKLDSDTIVTGLLHDTVEDTVATITEIESLFGKSVASLVDGVTKLSKLELQSDDKRQVENFRKLLLATSRDIRVLLVKLADRQHNMQTLHHIKSSGKRSRIARETLEIFAPLAERIGMHQLKDNLEDLAFSELHTDARSTIVARLSFLREEAVEQDIIGQIGDELTNVLKSAGIKASISGREKSPYSIWRKMQQKNVEFERLSDIMAFRVVVDNIGDCYKALGIVHKEYRCVPGRFKDYISTPKRNGYRSIHTGVIGPLRLRLEIQFRTQEMCDVAEFGVAAHWRYKESSDPIETVEYGWVKELLEILDDVADQEEFFERTRLDLYKDRVFCFTPKGELIALPQGATPVDFAYEVHSEVGDSCVSAKINGRTIPLKTKLQNGDQVQIITSKAGTPEPEWEQYVVTGKARSRIRSFIRSQRRNECIKLGAAILDKSIASRGIKISDKLLEDALPRLDANDIDALFLQVGEGDLNADLITDIIVGTKQIPQTVGKIKNFKKNGGHAISLQGLKAGLMVHYSNCCHPLPGDRIVGIRAPGKGVAIHTIDCISLESFYDMPERWMDVSWDYPSAKKTTHVGRLTLQVENQRGTLAALAAGVANNDGNIINLKIINREPSWFELALDIEVRDARHLNEIIASLRSLSVVGTVDREVL